MIHWKREGKHVYQGISIYHPKDNSSAGFVLRFGNHFVICRYSKVAKKWFTSYNKVVPNTLQVWETKHGLKK